MDNFERLMALAEFGANRHNERRQIEFRIFISYTTLLALILYYVLTKGESLWSPNDWLPAVPLLIVHWIYYLWQRSLGVAMENDTKRRNFFLAKAECLAHYFIERPRCEKFKPCNKMVKLKFGGNTEISEKELFKAVSPPDMLLLPFSWKRALEHWDKTWIDWSRRLQCTIPTVMLVTLFFLKLGFSWLGLLTLFLLAVLSLILPFVSLCWRKRKRNDNPRIPKANRGGLLRTRR